MLMRDAIPRFDTPKASAARGGRRDPAAGKGTRPPAPSCLTGERRVPMANDQPVGELERFLAERGDRLMRTAVLLPGGREAGQDLLQTALERLRRHWHKP